MKTQDLSIMLPDGRTVVIQEPQTKRKFKYWTDQLAFKRHEAQVKRLRRRQSPKRGAKR